MVKRLNGLALVELLIVLSLIGFLIQPISQLTQVIIKKQGKLLTQQSLLINEVNHIYLQFDNHQLNSVDQLALCESEWFKIIYVCL